MIRVPAELTDYKQWVLWRRMEVNGRMTKMPISPWSGKAAVCDKPQTWTTFRHVCVALKRFRADGIGFVFTEADPFCGIDLDSCRAKDGQINDESLKLICQMSSYAEISPSGNGVHIFVKAELGSSGRRTTGLEVYASGRYFTMTGKRLDGTPERIEERQEELDKLLKERFPSEPDTAEPRVTPPLGLSDAGLLERAFRAKSGIRFRKLWSGDASDYEVRIVEVRHPEISCAELCPAQIRIDKLRTAKVRTAEVRVLEVRPVELRSAEVRLNIVILGSPLVPRLSTLLDDLDLRMVSHLPSIQR